MSIEDAARAFLRSNYGNLIGMGEGILEDETNLYRFPLRSKYPFSITEDIDGQRRQVKTIRMERLGWIYINETTGRIDKSRTTKRKEAITAIEEYLDFWRGRSERIVASVTADNLANINQFRIFFTPIDRIIGLISMVGSLTDGDIDEMDREKTKTLRYARLLEGLDLLARENGEWKPTVLFHQIDSKYKSLDKKVKHIISLIFRDRYKTIRHVFGFNNVERIVRLQNVVYLPEMEIKRNLLRKSQTIQEEYRYHYNTRLTRLELIGDIAGLLDVKVIQKDKEKRFSGQEDFLEEMLKQVSTMKPLHLAYVGTAGAHRRTIRLSEGKTKGRIQETRSRHQQVLLTA